MFSPLSYFYRDILGLCFERIISKIFYRQSNHYVCLIVICRLEKAIFVAEKTEVPEIFRIPGTFEIKT